MNQEKTVVELSKIVFRDDLYPRIKHDPALVQRYAENIDVLPPIEVNQHCELIDGWHRWTAHRKVNAESIKVKVTPTKNDNGLFYLSHLKHSFEKENTSVFWSTLESIGITATNDDARILIASQPFLVEYVISKMLDAKLPARNTAGYDMTLKNGRKLQVKLSTCGVWRNIKNESDDHLLIDCRDGIIKNAIFADTERVIRLWSVNGSVKLQRYFPNDWNEFDLLCTMVNKRVNFYSMMEM